MQYMRNIILGHLVSVTASPNCPRFDGFDRDIDFSGGTEEKVGYILCLSYHMTSYACIMMTSSNGNIFRATGHLCGEFTGPR